MPVLLLGGAQDPLRDAGRIAARLKGCVPHLESTVYAHAGHVLVDTTPRVEFFLDMA